MLNSWSLLSLLVWFTFSSTHLRCSLWWKCSLHLTAHPRDTVFSQVISSNGSLTSKDLLNSHLTHKAYPDNPLTLQPSPWQCWFPWPFTSFSFPQNTYFHLIYQAIYLSITFNVYFLHSLPSPFPTWMLEYNLYRGRDFCLLSSLMCLKQYLTHQRWLIKMCWINAE